MSMDSTKYNSYSGIHVYLRLVYGKATYCSNDRTHTAKKFEWANITNNYTKDIKDYKPMCPSCHRKMDYTEKQREAVRKANLGVPNSKRMKVKQFTKEGIFIKEFDVIRDAERELGVLHTAIANVLSNRAKTAGGFIWRY